MTHLHQHTPKSIVSTQPRPILPRIVLAILAAVTLACSASAQRVVTQSDATIDQALREQTVDRIGELLTARYVFPDVAARCAEHISEQLRSGSYDRYASAAPFADALTRDLQSISKDKHLRVRPRVADAPSLGDDEREPTPEEQLAMRQRMTENMRKDNFGFEKIERLQGNVGYLDLRGFVPAEIGGETAIAAMNLLANADAVIIDLRRNGGGSPSMIQLISTYFFDEPTLLNTMYWREGDRTDQFWTLPHVPGRRMADTPLFILTSNYTFSGAEEFSYNMKNLKRGTLIGETTGGGAHPGGNVPVNDLFAMFVPVGRAINPTSKTNWEGTGVEPDIAMPASQALTFAHAKAIESLENNASDPLTKARLAWARTAIEAGLNPVPVLTETQMNRFAGTYGERRIWVENGRLMYQRGDMPARSLAPMSEDLFALEDVPYFRIRFERDSSGKVIRLVGVYDDGRNEPSDRD